MKKILGALLLGVLVLTLLILFNSRASLWFRIHFNPDFIELNGVGTSCRIAAQCNGLVGVNCNAAVDGPYYYVEKDSGKIVAYCGGYCMTGKCVNCPPKEWTCR